MTKIYKAGEHVRIVRTDPAYDSKLGDQTGLVGTVTTGTDSGHVWVRFPHTGDDIFYYLESEVEQVGTPAAEKPQTEPKFKVGDWVEVHGRGDKWDGRVATIKSDSVDHANFWTVQLDGKSGSEHRAAFQESKLKLTKKPFEPKFKLGDWVRTDWSKDWDAVVSQVIELPTSEDGYYKIKTSAASGFLPKGHEGGFKDYTLKAAEAPKPEEPHWAFTKPVGTAARVGQRTIVKVEEDKWLFVYDTRTASPYVVYRNNQSTKNVLGYEVAVFNSAF